MAVQMVVKVLFPDDGCLFVTGDYNGLSYHGLLRRDDSGLSASGRYTGNSQKLEAWPVENGCVQIEANCVAVSDVACGVRQVHDRVRQSTRILSSIFDASSGNEPTVSPKVHPALADKPPDVSLNKTNDFPLDNFDYQHECAHEPLDLTDLREHVVHMFSPENTSKERVTTDAYVNDYLKETVTTMLKERLDMCAAECMPAPLRKGVVSPESELSWTGTNLSRSCGWMADELSNSYTAMLPSPNTNWSDNHVGSWKHLFAGAQGTAMNSGQVSHTDENFLEPKKTPGRCSKRQRSLTSENIISFKRRRTLSRRHMECYNSCCLCRASSESIPASTAKRSKATNPRRKFASCLFGEVSEIVMTIDEAFLDYWDDGYPCNPFGVEIGDVVWAKVAGCAWWPGRVCAVYAHGGLSPQHEDCCVVWFGSDQSVSYVLFAAVEPFEERFPKHYNVKPKRQAAAYQLAVAQAIQAATQRYADDASRTWVSFMAYHMLVTDECWQHVVDEHMTLMHLTPLDDVVPPAWVELSPVETGQHKPSIHDHTTVAALVRKRHKQSIEACAEQSFSTVLDGWTDRGVSRFTAGSSTDKAESTSSSGNDSSENAIDFLIDGCHNNHSYSYCRCTPMPLQVSVMSAWTVECGDTNNEALVTSGTSSLPSALGDSVLLIVKSELEQS